MVNETKRDWSEWSRFTLSAAGGVLVGIVSTILWLSGVANTAEEARAENIKQDVNIVKLSDIAGDMRIAVTRLIALQEAHDQRIKALEERASR